MIRMVRVIIDSVVEGAIKRLTASGVFGETFTDREYMQHYGFTSRPLEGAEGVAIADGNHVIVVASDDRRYRVAIEDGEVCLYTDEGDFILLGRNRQMHISTGGKLTVDAASAVEINTIDAVVNTTGKCQVNSPQINLGGDRGGLQRLIDERFASTFDAHVHAGGSLGAGNTGTPVAAMVVADVATDVVRAC